MELEAITPESFSQGVDQLYSFPRAVIVKPNAHDSRINSIGPIKFRKLGSVGRVTKYIKIPPTKGKKKIKFKKQSQKYNDV